MTNISEYDIVHYIVDFWDVRIKESGVLSIQPIPKIKILIKSENIYRTTIFKESKKMQEVKTTPQSVNPFTALTKYAQFSGRARRSEFWLFALINFLISMIPYLGWVWALVVLIPSWAVFCRRMHDTGRSGWNWLWALLPFVGPIVLLVYECQDSVPGVNQYGPNPKGIGNE